MKDALFKVFDDLDNKKAIANYLFDIIKKKEPLVTGALFFE